MEDNYIDHFGGKEKNTNSENSKLYVVPLVMGILSFVCFAVYLWSAFHSRSAVMSIICLVPLFSIIGLIFSSVTRSARYEHFKIWFWGLISCVLGIAFQMFIFLGTMMAIAQK